MQPRQNIIATRHEHQPARTKGPQSQAHRSSQTVLATNTHLRLQGCARKTLHPCTLETSQVPGSSPWFFAPSPSKAAALRSHKHCFLAALNLPYPQRNGKTYSRISPSRRWNSVDFQTFLTPVLAHKPMKNSQFQHPLPRSLSARAIPNNLWRLNAHPSPFGTTPRHVPALLLHLQPTRTRASPNPATNTHLRLQGCARKTLQPCNLETPSALSAVSSLGKMSRSLPKYIAMARAIGTRTDHRNRTRRASNREGTTANAPRSTP